MATTAQAGLRNCSSASSSFFLISCLLFLLLLLLLRFLHLHFLLLCKIFFAFFFSFLSISICRVQTNFSWSWTLIFRVSFLWVLAFCQDVNVMMWVFCTWVLLWSLDLSSACVSTEIVLSSFLMTCRWTWNIMTPDIVFVNGHAPLNDHQ